METAVHLQQLRTYARLRKAQTVLKETLGSIEDEKGNLVGMRKRMGKFYDDEARINKKLYIEGTLDEKKRQFVVLDKEYKDSLLLYRNNIENKAKELSSMKNKYATERAKQKAILKKELSDANERKNTAKLSVVENNKLHDVSEKRYKKMKARASDMEKTLRKAELKTEKAKDELKRVKGETAREHGILERRTIAVNESERKLHLYQTRMKGWAIRLKVQLPKT